MRKVCAWCKKDLDIEEEDAAQGVITHGICSLCALEITRNVQRSAQDIINILDKPIFVVGPDGVVQGTNKKGQEVLGKTVEGIENKLVGDAFECSRSKLSEGCGRTVHCATCTIRNIIMDTLATGKNYEKVPAFQIVSTPDGEIIQRYIMSTERVGASILLRIDEVVQDKHNKNESGSLNKVDQDNNLKN